MRKFPIALIVSGGLLLTATPATLADPPQPAHPHQHYLTTPGGTHEVGPNRCENANTAQGFNGFHWNVHRGTPSTDAFSNENNPVAISGAHCPPA